MASVPKLLLLALLCSYHSLVAHAADARTHKVLDIESMTPKTVCSESKAVPSSTGGTTLPLHHRHGPCSPVSSKKLPTLEEMLQRDQLRAAYIQRKISRATGGSGVKESNATVPTTLGTKENSLEYVIKVELGSPAVTQTVLIDTGSDVSWVQCKPCTQCHDQADSLFDPSASSTYSPFSCGSGACAQLGVEGAGCTSSQCQYFVQYGDESITTGTYSSDTLKLGSDSVKSFQFGCSHEESGFDDDDRTAGLMGLGGGPQSLVSQTAGTFGKAFSYCLPASSDSPGFLTLGAGTTTTSGFVKTPMLRSNQPTFYGVRLEAIRVGGKQLNIPSSVFSSGSILDSGTVLTYLPQAAYSALSSAFKAGMKQYPSAPPKGPLDTCFDFSGQSTIKFPTVALVFTDGAVVNLDGSGVIVEDCLAFSASDGLSIIGNVQQRTLEVLYDVGGGAVGFRAGAC
ncbi:hypothetical protein EJB05_19804 [Eragrostis curvula]|uniref:Peptidase A1 domain-containing protein n=1 Tax=Eragrostis curvula TaxID=38414 RepID=A0A5J9UX16_9POAL|nr:hypothetical protein EJB05_19804 [Eragrostis curvula]